MTCLPSSNSVTLGPQISHKGGFSKRRTRGRPFRAQCQGRDVKLVRGDWNAAYLDERSVFPAGRPDDQEPWLCVVCGNMLWTRIAVDAEAERETPLPSDDTNPPDSKR